MPKLGMNAVAVFADTPDQITGGWEPWPGTGLPSNMPILTNEACNITDLNIDMSKSDVDVTTRCNDGWRSTLGGLKEGTATFDMFYDTGDKFFDALFTAWQSATPKELAIVFLDSLLDGAEGLYAPWAVTQFSIQQPLEEGQRVSVTLRTTSAIYIDLSQFVPVWVKYATQA